MQICWQAGLARCCYCWLAVAKRGWPEQAAGGRGQPELAMAGCC